MKISEAITHVQALTGQVVDNATLVRWLSELDGQLALSFYRAESYEPYNTVTDMATSLLVPYPWDGLYVNHLAAMTYFTNGEYDRYENERVMSEKILSDFRAFMQRSKGKCCPPGFPLPDNGHGGGIDPSDATATAGDILAGKTAYIADGKSTGTIPSQAAQTITPGTEDQTIPAGIYLAGAQTIKGDADLVSSNIAAGVSIFGVQGSHQGGGGTDVSDTTATAGDVLAGEYFYSAQGVKTQGTIPAKAASDVSVNGNAVTVPVGYYGTEVSKTVGTEQAAQTITPTTTDQTIPAGKYLSGAQTIKGDSNLIAGNIKKNVTLFGVTGNYEGSGGGGIDPSDATASASDILSGKTAYIADGTKATGTIQSQAAQTITPTTSDQTISAGKYLSGAQTIKGDAALVAGNIKSGVSIFGVAGSYGGGTDTSDATITGAGQLLSGVTAYGASGKVTGSIPTKTAADLTASGLTVTAPAGYYATSAAKTLTDANLIAANIKAGVTIFGVTGTYTGSDLSDATATAGDILYGKTAYTANGKITGTLQLSNSLSGAQNFAVDYSNGTLTIVQTPAVEA